MPFDASEHRAPMIKAYLKSQKVVSGRLFWRSKNHPDFVEAKLPVTCAEMPEINGELRLIAHKTRVPHKYGFTLLVGSGRITGLDVNPGSTHFNLTSLTSVSGTHWQWFPTYEAEADNRELTHRDWLAEFCERTNIDFQSAYLLPPHVPVQLVLI